MGKALGPSHYVLSEQQMEKYDYPLYVLDENGDKRCPPGYVETVPPGVLAERNDIRIAQSVFW